MNHSLLRSFLVLSLVLLVSACTPNKIYRDVNELCTYNGPGDCTANALQIYAPGANDEYHLGFIEYDDQGQLHDPEQMDAVVTEYYGLAVEDDVLLIAFVHGWQHNAGSEDKNILSFRQMLADVSAAEGVGSNQQNRAKRKVLGLYVGWRGKSLNLPVINNLTFWDRKNTAHDVGQQGVTEALLKLEEIVNVKVGIEEENPPPVNSRLVVIGHSFGGAVVYTSLQKILADRFIDSRRGKTMQDDAKGFGDLVVLMNPAFEAMRFATLYDLSQNGCRRYFSTQVPRLAILTSEADYATKYAFTAGRLFSTLFESHLELDRHYCSQPGKSGIQQMQIEEGQADRHAVGHFTPYMTHRLDATTTRMARQADYKINTILTVWAEHKNDKPLEFDGSRLVSLNRTTPLNPYLNISVDKVLISDHNDIWGPQVVDFIRELIVISTTPRSSLE